MRESVVYKKKLFIENKEILCKAYPLENSHVLLYVAYSAAAQGIRVDADTLKACGKLIRDKVAWYSDMRGISKVPLSFMLSRREGGESTLDELNDATIFLKQQKFHSTNERVLCARMLVEYAERECRAEIAEKARRIYVSLRENHPFLTGSDVYPYVVLMAMSEKDERSLVCDSEAAYAVLKPVLGAHDSTQALSLIFSTREDAVAESHKFLALYAAMKAVKNPKCKFDTGCVEIAALGILSVYDSREICEIVAEVGEISEELKKEKGFGGVFGYVSRNQRLMYACMLAMDDAECGVSDAVNFGAVIAQIAAETAAMVAVIAATSASAAAAAH